MKKKHNYAVAALILTNIIFGAASPIFKWTLQNMSFFSFLFLRFLLASLIFLPIALKKGQKIKKGDEMMFIKIGMMIFLHMIFYFLGIEYAPSINAPIIASSGPVLMVLLSIRLLHEHPRKKVIIGTITGLLGVLIIVVKPLQYPLISASNEIFGNLFHVFATLFSIFHAIESKKALKKYSSLTVTFYYLTFLAIAFFPFFARELYTQGHLPVFNIQALLGLTFAVIFVTLIGHSLFMWGVSRIQASEIGIFTYIDPIITVVIAIPLLGESITIPFVIGSFLVFSGIFIAEGRIHYHPLHKIKQK